MKRLQEQAAYIATLEPEFQALSDDELRGKTAEFRQRLENGEELDNLLFEAYAAVREARLRESDQRMFDVQMMGGIVLHEGDVAEMKTGEGKTFVASLALYLNALPTSTTRDGRIIGQGVHLVTVNDYLAQRDAEWNRGVYERLGMTVAFIETMMPFDAAQARLRRRHHLRHELRVRLRLPARQHGDLARRRRPARPSFRDRRRGRLDPDRRGAHAADHLGRADDGGEDVLRLRAHRARGCAASQSKGTKAEDEALAARVRLPLRREAQDRRRRREPGSRRSSARSRSTTSTTRATSSSSTT